MPAKFKKGDTAYFVESNYKVREVQILNTAGGLRNITWHCYGI